MDLNEHNSRLLEENEELLHRMQNVLHPLTQQQPDAGALSQEVRACLDGKLFSGIE